MKRKVLGGGNKMMQNLGLFTSINMNHGPSVRTGTLSFDIEAPSVETIAMLAQADGQLGEPETEDDPTVRLQPISIVDLRTREFARADPRATPAILAKAEVRESSAGAGDSEDEEAVLDGEEGGMPPQVLAPRARTPGSAGSSRSRLPRASDKF